MGDKSSFNMAYGTRTKSGEDKLCDDTSLVADKLVWPGYIFRHLNTNMQFQEWCVIDLRLLQWWILTSLSHEMFLIAQRKKKEIFFFFFNLTSQEMTQNRETWVHNELGHPCVTLTSVVWWICFLLTAYRGVAQWSREVCGQHDDDVENATVKHGLSTGKFVLAEERCSRRMWASDSLVKREEVVSATSSALILSEPVSLENNLPILLSSDSFLFSSFWQKYLL